MCSRILGHHVAGFWWLGNLVHPILAGLLGLLVWVWVTGALHLDGLSDLVDALGAAHANEERFFKVLEDPHVGSFGVVALVLQLLAKLILLTLLANVDMSAWWLVFVAAWARLGAAWWSLSLPSIKPGLGETFAWQGKPYIFWPNDDFNRFIFSHSTIYGFKFLTIEFDKVVLNHLA